MGETIPESRSHKIACPSSHASNRIEPQSYNLRLLDTPIHSAFLWEFEVLGAKGLGNLGEEMTQTKGAMKSQSQSCLPPLSEFGKNM